MDDLISRQAAIDALRNQMSDWNDDYNVPVRKSIENIERLPSAQPYTDEQIQKMQELEQAEIEKAYELGRESAEAEQVKSVNVNLLLNEEQMEYILEQTKKQISQAPIELDNNSTKLDSKNDELIGRLSEIRSQYNCFDKSDEPYYHALSEAIKRLSVQPEITFCKTCEYSYYSDNRVPEE